MDPATTVAINARHIKAPIIGVAPDSGVKHDATLIVAALNDLSQWGPAAIHFDSMDPACVWCGRVFLNSPGGRSRPRAQDWWGKLQAAYAVGDVTQAFFVSFSLDILQTSQSKSAGGALAYPTFVPDTRIAYDDPVTGGPLMVPHPKKPGVMVEGSAPKPSCFTWLPPHDWAHGRLSASRVVQNAFDAQGIAGVCV